MLGKASGTPTGDAWRTLRRRRLWPSARMSSRWALKMTSTAISKRGLSSSIFLPPIPLTAAQVDTISHDLSFEHLLELVIQSTSTNFILIIHGQPDGSGLFLPLFRNSSKQDTFHYDLQKLMDVDANESTMSEAISASWDLGRSTPIPRRRSSNTIAKDPRQERVEKMLDLMHQVRNKKIDCIEFRSCNLGKNVLSLQRFREFLGARLAGAPDLHTVFGRPDTRVGDKTFSIFIWRTHRITKDGAVLGRRTTFHGLTAVKSRRRTADPADSCAASV